MRIGFMTGLFFLCVTIVQGQPKPVHPEIAAVLKEIRQFEQQKWKKDSAAGRVLGSFTEEAFQQQYRFYQQVAERLDHIDKKTLSFDNQVNLALLQHEVREDLSTVRFRSYLNPILSDWGFHTSLAGRANTTLRNKKEAETYLRLL